MFSGREYASVRYRLEASGAATVGPVERHRTVNGLNITSRTGSRSEWIESVLDLVIVAAYLVVTDAVFVLVSGETALKGLLGVPLLLFLPGYAIVSGLFPRQRAPGTDRSQGSVTSDATDRFALRWNDRLLLSVATSIAVVPPLAVLLGVSGYGLTREWLLVGSIEAIILAGLAVGAVRRRRQPPGDRFRLQYRRLPDRTGSLVPSSRTSVDRGLSVALAVLIVLSVATFGYAMVEPPSGEQFSTLTVVTENESGEYVADGYPSDLARGERAELVVGVENHEGEPMEYGVVAVLQRVDRSGESLTVRQRQRLDSFQVELGANETTHETTTVVPELSGSNLRLVFLMYRGDPPENPSVDTSYRHVFLWVNVSANGATIDETASSRGE